MLQPTGDSSEQASGTNFRCTGASRLQEENAALGFHPLCLFKAEVSLDSPSRQVS